MKNIYASAAQYALRSLMHSPLKAADMGMLNPNLAVFILSNRNNDENLVLFI
jgi:hypothetical protein